MYQHESKFFRRGADADPDGDRDPRHNLDYIDINTALKNNTDALYSGYSSDGYVHMNTTGYGVWAGQITSYVRSMLAAERHIYRYRGT